MKEIVGAHFVKADKGNIPGSLASREPFLMQSSDNIRGDAAAPSTPASLAVLSDSPSPNTVQPGSNFAEIEILREDQVDRGGAQGVSFQADETTHFVVRMSKSSRFCWHTRLNRLTARATGLEVLTGSAESTTVGNFAIQLTALDEDYADGVGVSASGVAKWASVLAAQPIDVEK